jgi:hypothetical protein
MKLRVHCSVMNISEKAGAKMSSQNRICRLNAVHHLHFVRMKLWGFLLALRVDAIETPVSWDSQQVILLDSV